MLVPSRSLLFRFVPALDALRTYTFADARADLVAGLTVATVAVPQAMAYALLAGVPPEYGLYTAIVMTAVGAVFDSSRQLINGPTNAISIAVLSALAGLEGTDARIAAAVLLALMIGGLQLGITLLRLGDLTRYVSHSVIVGFTVGASALLVLDQTKNLLGLKAMGDAHDHFLVRFFTTMTEGGPVHVPTLALGLGTIGCVLLLRALKHRIGWTLFPDLLATVVIAAVAVRALGLDAVGVKVVGEIPAKLPTFHAPVLDVAQMRELAPSALAIAVLGLLEAISMAKAIAARTGQKLDMNQQCLSEGVANVAGSLFQCIPGSGSLTRSAINQQAGGRTQWSGVVSAVAVAGIVVLLAPYARFIPRTALAGILLVASWRMIDWHALRYHLRASRFDAGIVLVTAFAAVAISIEFCVLVGVLLSFLLAVPRAGRMLLTEFVVTEDRVIHERMEDEEIDPRVLIFGLEGELFFGSAADLEAHLDQIGARVTDHTRFVVLRLKRVRSPDAVCMTLLEGFVAKMHDRGVRVLACGVRSDLHGAMEKVGLIGMLAPEELFLEQPVRNTSTLMAVRAAYDRLEGPVRRTEGLYFMI